jgi:hypothetical protein
MFKRGGVRVFVVGTGATVNRDLVFGGVYALMRHELLTSAKNDEDRKNNKKKTPPGFLVNLISACIATVASSPWNYVRNVHYATEKGQSPLPSWAIVRGLWDDAMREGSLFERVRFLQTRLRIGWGTVRVLLVAKNGLALQNSQLHKLLTLSTNFSSSLSLSLSHTRNAGTRRVRHGLWRHCVRSLLLRSVFAGVKGGMVFARSVLDCSVPLM